VFHSSIVIAERGLGRIEALLKTFHPPSTLEEHVELLLYLPTSAVLVLDFTVSSTPFPFIHHV
jgi:hypothetical protein